MISMAYVACSRCDLYVNWASKLIPRYLGTPGPDGRVAGHPLPGTVAKTIALRPVGSRCHEWFYGTEIL